ncbi:MAG: serine dehydratase subunit alpha family protein, partial [Erysipelotrichaceae bacterium]|nr:serine dehydratase subunit alpha family protein [Erysipelotrichaceae bacterium]
MEEKIYQAYTAILQEELIPAMGCTEPIALAYAAAKAREYLEHRPDYIETKCSGNMIKNVRCVQIPNSGGMIGIEAAVCLGAFGGDANRKMEVLESVTGIARQRTMEFIEQGKCKVRFLDSDIPLHFTVELHNQDDCVIVEVQYSHTNIVKIIKNNTVIFENEGEAEETTVDRSILTVENIKEYADTVDLETIRSIFERQIRCNMEIAEEGMSGSYGVGVGRMIRNNYPESLVTRMRASAAAASEARMAGCDMPVIINSGSGNQGIASSVPVIVYAREHFIPKDKLIRALAFSGLLTVHQKEYIGKLSAFCGAVSATCAAG